MTNDIPKINIKDGIIKSNSICDDDDSIPIPSNETKENTVITAHIASPNIRKSIGFTTSRYNWASFPEDRASNDLDLFFRYGPGPFFFDRVYDVIGSPSDLIDKEVIRGE